jgi:phage terminase Nu1 subunit (DNA packaging protein)
VAAFDSVGYKVTDRWVNILAKKEGLPRLGRGQYDLVDCLKWYIARLSKQAEEAATGTGTALQNAELRIARAKAEILEERLAKQRGDAVGLDIVQRAIEPAIQSARSILLGLPKKVAREFSNKEIEGYLDGTVRKLLIDLSEIPHELERLGQFESIAQEVLSNMDAAAQDDGLPMGGRKKKVEPRAKRGERELVHGGG